MIDCFSHLGFIFFENVNVDIRGNFGVAMSEVLGNSLNVKAVIITKSPAMQSFLYIRNNKLSLGELACATSGLETVLLSFLHTRVASQEACCLESGLVCLVSENECAGEAVADRACLAGETAACYVCNDIELTNVAGNLEGLVYDELHCVETEVLVNVAAVDGDSTGTGIYSNASYRLLSSAGSVEIRLCTGIHLQLLLSTSDQLRAMGF